MARYLTTADAWRAERQQVARRRPAAALPNVQPDDSDDWHMTRGMVALVITATAGLWFGVFLLVRVALPLLDAAGQAVR